SVVDIFVAPYGVMAPKVFGRLACVVGEPLVYQPWTVRSKWSRSLGADYTDRLE
ncbi:MAG: hypothetical protein QOC83_6601, partial [Pseudonocardiales bacterium]|nr:hypothetical protein [Pseudonocardiales bacterium]